MLINELNILKAQEVVGEPNSVGTPKKIKDKVGKENDGSKKRNSTDSISPANKKKTRPSRNKVTN